MNSIPITRRLPIPGAFWEFNREERNAVSVLVGLLGHAQNLKLFSDRLGWSPPDLEECEFSIEWSFLRDLWSLHSRTLPTDELRLAILECLQPDDREQLKTCSVVEFNTHFGAVPRPSTSFIQSPGNWSVARFDPNITNNDDFVRTCRFKWAFNIKPDLVLQTPSGHVLCIEAKWDSGEGQYPASETEKAIFNRRRLECLNQTEVQRYLVNDVLGLNGTFAYLARSHIETDAGQCITWADILPALDRSGAPQFVRDWCDKEIRLT